MAVALIVAAGRGRAPGAGGPRRSSSSAGRPMLAVERRGARAPSRRSSRSWSRCRRAWRRRRGRRRRRAATCARSRCAARSRPRRPGERSGAGPRRRAAAASRPALAERCSRGSTRVEGSTRDRGRAGDGHDQARRRRARHAHGRPLAAVGGPDAAGLPPRGARARARVARRIVARPPTRRGSSSAPAGGCGSSRRRARTSR